MRRDIPFIGALILAALAALSTRISGALAAAYKARVFLPVSSALRRLSASPASAALMAIGLIVLLAVCLRPKSRKRRAARGGHFAIRLRHHAG